MTKLTQLPAWQALTDHFREMQNKHMRDLFAANPDRFSQMHLQQMGILFDYSKNRVEPKTIDLLIKLAEESNLKTAIEQMFTGEKINFTEGRAVLHTALRNRSTTPVMVDGEDVMPEINRVLEQMHKFSESVRSGEWRGFSDKPIKAIVNIGIGGSDLGPLMVTEALKAYSQRDLKVFFVSNVDGADLQEVLMQVDAETTLFMIASKTFTTQETMLNADTARQWFLAKAENVDHIKKHFVALSTNREKVIEFGIDPQNMFAFWDFVGGRYSLWSAIGLSIACSIGFANFAELLAGAEEADQHFRTESFENNMPVLMALLGIWYNNFFGAQTHAILPYSKYLSRFAAYFQQGDMESNGKSVSKDGQTISEYETGPVIWGEPGTNGQHAFYQLIHQGTKLVPADFIGYVKPLNSPLNHHDILMSNFFAQTEALMAGKDLATVKAELQASGMESAAIDAVAPFKVMAGNHPTNTLLVDELTPRMLGKLIALYEHKIFAQGIIWQVNSFDQWGVELGKQLAKNIQNEMQSGTIGEHDSSTTALVDYYLKNK
jgi:glucose-6-phosphate isomerase